MKTVTYPLLFIVLFLDTRMADARLTNYTYNSNTPPVFNYITGSELIPPPVFTIVNTLPAAFVTANGISWNANR